jgi:hypothetical protein
MKSATAGEQQLRFLPLRATPQGSTPENNVCACRDNCFGHHHHHGLVINDDVCRKNHVGL